MTIVKQSLLPCPLCGSEDIGVGNAYLDNGSNAAEVECKNGMCELQLIVFYDEGTKNAPGDRVANTYDEAKQEVIRRWNLRYK